MHFDENVPDGATSPQVLSRLQNCDAGRPSAQASYRMAYIPQCHHVSGSKYRRLPWQLPRAPAPATPGGSKFAMENSATSWQRHTSNRHLLLADAKPRLLSEPSETGLKALLWDETPYGDTLRSGHQPMRWGGSAQGVLPHLAVTGDRQAVGASRRAQYRTTRGHTEVGGVGGLRSAESNLVPALSSPIAPTPSEESVIKSERRDKVSS